MSVAASMALIGGLASKLSASRFVACQVAFAVIGAGVALGDGGLSLWLTRGIAERQLGTDAATVLSTRLCFSVIVVLTALLPLTIAGDVQVFTYAITLVPYLVALATRAHLYSQLRAGRGIALEAVSYPLFNLAESTGAFALILLGLPITLALVMMGIIATVQTAYLYRMNAPYGLSVTMGAPSVNLLRGSVAAAAVPLIYGVLVKCQIVALGLFKNAIAVDPETLAWYATALRSADAVFNVATLLVIVPRHVGAARSRVVKAPSPGVFVSALFFGAATIVGPSLVLRRVPTSTEVVISFALAVQLTCWLTGSLRAHISHAERGNRRLASAVLDMTLGLTLLAALMTYSVWMIGLAIGALLFTAKSEWSGLAAQDR